MVVVATKFTPEVLLSAPRRSAAVPNCTGKLALYTVSQYSFVSHSKSVAIKLLDIASGESTSLYENPDYTEPTWVSEKEFVFVNNSSDSESACSLCVADVSQPGSEPHVIQTFKSAITNLKAKAIGHGTVAFACTAPATPAGGMYSTVDEKKPLSSARVYSSLFVRHWDHYVPTEHRSAVFYGALGKSGRDGAGPYELRGPGGGRLVNALAGTRLECPVPPFGDAGDYDIGPRGLVFVSRDPDLNPALWTKSDLYYVPLASFTETKPPAPRLVRTSDDLRGYTGAPAFSHDGRRVAFKRMAHARYEADKWRLLLLPDVVDGDLEADVREFYRTADGAGGWDLRPEALAWSRDDAHLYVTAEAAGRQLLHRLPSDPAAAEAAGPPTPLPGPEGSVGDFFTLPGTAAAADDDDGGDDGCLLVTSTSLTESSAYSILDPAARSTTLVSSSSHKGRSFGLSRSQVDEFWFAGAGDYKCHALVFKPSDFKPSKTYPLAFLIHGGPQGAWGDSWSTRWNPAVFAEQGYVVVMPNPTGSTGYGQAYVDAIARDWGGRPYRDLVNCFEHVADRMPYVDTTNAVALGASYGGYMISE
ncbi:prolyl oligopeptidase [Xylariaceae sp. FL0804]|nr:prolyl oligopeptidase [Xylariaceae sp. FL0804]